MPNLSIKQKIEREKIAINYAISRFNLALANNNTDEALWFHQETRRSLESIKELEKQAEELEQVINLLHEYGYHNLYELEKGRWLDARS